MSENIDDKLSKVKYNSDIKTHLRPDLTKCVKCQNRVCETVCPANVYAFDKDQNTLLVRFENCLECGACKIVCENIEWEYPNALFGVSFKNG